MKSSLEFSKYLVSSYFALTDLASLTEYYMMLLNVRITQHISVSTMVQLVMQSPERVNVCLATIP